MAKTKKDTAQLNRIYKALGDRLDFTLAKLIEEGKPIPPALATAAAGYLKLHKIGEDIAKTEAEEAVQQSSSTFVPRISVDDLPTPEAYEEQVIIEEQGQSLGIQPVEWTPKERRMMGETANTNTNEEESF